MTELSESEWMQKWGLITDIEVLTFTSFYCNKFTTPYMTT